MFSINLKRSVTMLAVTAGLLASAVPAAAYAAERDSSVAHSTVKSDSNEISVEELMAGGNATLLNATLLDHHGQSVGAPTTTWAAPPLSSSNAMPQARSAVRETPLSCQRRP